MPVTRASHTTPSLSCAKLCKLISLTVTGSRARRTVPASEAASACRGIDGSRGKLGVCCSDVAGGAASATQVDPSTQAPSVMPVPPPADTAAALNASMQSRYEQAFSMSQLYAAERPPPIPPSEHERRRRVKDVQEVVEAGRRRGLKEDAVRSGLAALDSLLPGVLSLHRMKPSDWAAVAADVDGTAEKIILLTSLYPGADIFRLVFRRPKLLLQSTQRLREDAAQIMRLLSSSPAPCVILEATPDLLDPLSLSRCLATLAAAYPGKDPVALLQAHPDILANSGSEAAVELTAEYGELSTKD